MVDDGIEPDIFCLNSMIKGYVLSLHVNDALRIFHQMGVMYECQPNSFSYDYLIHGLCAQGRTNNARELCDTMKKSGFVPSSKSYNSLVNSLALEGEIDEA
ncbi:Tetratricopeptide repeat superfamily protein, partial [Perilla frutescens var. hirtella]